MTVVKVNDGRVSVEDSVAIPRAVTGQELRGAFLEDIQTLTLGLVHVRGTSLYFGRLELLRFGSPTVTRSAVEWPIEGGITTRMPGGRWRIESAGGRLIASVEGYSPSLPLPLYAVTQLPIHHLITRLHLLRVRGREPIPGVPATSQNRMRAAAVDIAFCATLAGVAGRAQGAQSLIKRRKIRMLIGIAVAYHVLCWSVSGRTLGGLVMRQRVVAVDGSKPSLGQSVVRLFALPVAWVRRRPVHDEFAGTDVVHAAS